ncbi:MAG: NAD(P)H-dependent oxidoreductase [Bacteroidetes bacterium]|nr:NAD(P)H-dependent oxidoreductase [Bacteroidota bacterium]
MTDLKKIIAISGSTRASSTNLNLIKAIANLTTDRFDITIFEGLTELPHFNPDLDNAQPPEQITNFRNTLRKFDGILICTPEYAMGVPGTLKNAIDWTVSSMEFSRKPTALITASSVGQKGHSSLMETLKIIEAMITNETQLLIPFAKTKINSDCVITDDKTRIEIIQLLDSFHKIVSDK